MRHALRHILKNKSYAVINLCGLTLGLTVCTLILLYVQDELSYDRFLPGHDRVLRIQPVTSDGKETREWATSEGFLVPALASTYPEIEAGTRFIRSDNDIIFRHDSTTFAQDGAIAADEKFFDVFPFEFIEGDRRTALQRSDGIVLSAEMAKKFFGKGGAVGKTLVTSFATLQVTGVFRDVPVNSHFHFKMVFPLRTWDRAADESRHQYSFYSYVRLRSSKDMTSFILGKLAGWYEAHGYPVTEQRSAAVREVSVVLRGVSITDIHLTSNAEKEYEANSQKQIIWIFIAVALLILSIATINFINLSNAMAIQRAKEVAIRKTIGASRRKLFVDLLAESYVFTLAGFVLSVLFVGVLLRYTSVLSAKTLSASALANPWFIGIAVTAWVVLGFLSGFYPATVLSSFHPLQALRSNIRAGRSNAFSLNLRRGLIVFQFAISSFMIVCAFTIRQQMHFIVTRNLGFNKNNVLVLPLVDRAREIAFTLKNEMERLPDVASATLSSVVPGRRVIYLPVRIPGTQDNAETLPDGTTNMRVMSVDHDFVKTMGLQITQGRDFTATNAADVHGAFLLNEAAVKAFGLNAPIGQPFEYVFRRELKRGKIIGVVRDFHFASIHNKVEPLMLHIDSLFLTTISVRLKGEDHAATIGQLERVWSRTVDVPFSGQFLDVQYDSLYRSERETGRVITALTAVALTIACLGLFGVVSFFVVQRTREVSIRKVFGATASSLFGVLSHEYVLLVILGNLLAFYPAFAMSQQWLQQFSYRVSVSWINFVAAFSASSLLALFSIAYVIVKTSKVNPAVILRSE